MRGNGFDEKMAWRFRGVLVARRMVEVEDKGGREGSTRTL